MTPAPSATAVASPTATATPALIKAVALQDVNARRGPGIAYPVAAVIKGNATVILTGCDTALCNWYLTDHGWVAARFLRVCLPVEDTWTFN